MKRNEKSKKKVKGAHLPSARLTLWGFVMGVIYFGLPFLLVMALLDGFLFLLFKYGLGACYGIFCLLEGS